MEKLSLYDILNVLLPGIIFYFFLSQIDAVYQWFPEDSFTVFETSNEIKKLGVWLGISLFLGASLNVVNFIILKKKWYGKLFGIYTDVFTIYDKMKDLHPTFNLLFNKKGVLWYGKEIFLRDEVYSKLNKNEQKEIQNFQDNFYSRVYYELEYLGKIEQPKTFQSFYFFFRQNLLTSSILLLFSIIAHIMYMAVNGWNFQAAHVYLFLSLITLGILSKLLASWYRAKMVRKMYWTYFIHINQ